MNHLTFRKSQSAGRNLCAALLVLGFVAAIPARAEIPEPDTVFYGRIINRTSGQEYLLSSGTLTWVVSRADGRQINLTASVLPYNNETYSYRMLVPHEALAYGLTVSTNSVPLTAQSVRCTNLLIKVNGSPASILAPAGNGFYVSQSSRASTYRMDLEVTNSLPDTAGDGIPDWWKAKYGIVDPNADPDGDGWSNLQEYLNGSNPTNDNRLPTLATSELYVYGDGTTGIRLRAVDSDSAPTNLFYTLTAPPQTGTMYFRNRTAAGTNSDVALGTGGTFTQDDVNNGRLIFVHGGGSAPDLADSFSVSLHDETPSHPAATGTVALNLYRPAYDAATMQLAQAAAASPAGFASISGLSVYEQQMLLNYFLSRDQGYVLWDGSLGTAAQQMSVSSSGLTASQYSQYMSAYGRDRRAVMMAGVGNDRLVGGMENDILVSGSGNDSLRGNGGSDLFLILTPSASPVIEDFSLVDNDVLDISHVLNGTSTLLTDYVQLSNSGTNSYLRINFSGTGGSYSNMVITLLNTHFQQSDLRSLVDTGNLVTGSKVMPPQISIAATSPAASRNGPVPAVFTLTRAGATNADVPVNLQISGSAINGTDYQLIQSPQVFPAGQRTLTFTVNPYPSTVTVTQYVQVAVSPSSAYDQGATTVATVSIEPVAPQITIQAIEPIASRLDSTSGYLLVTRAGAINNSVLVRLTIGGSAPSSHYQSISPFINFVPQQTTALIAVTPKPTAVISNGLEYVQVTIKPDPSYRVFSPSTDRILLVDQIMTFPIWQQKYFPSSNEDPSLFAMEDPGNTGIKNLYRYAYGLNPFNPQRTNNIPIGKIVNDHLSLSFVRPPAISDLDYIVESSPDMRNWFSTSNDVIQYFPASSSNDVQTQFFQAVPAVSTTPSLFMRVRLEPQ
jgi:hypothetical protein